MQKFKKRIKVYSIYIFKTMIPCLLEDKNQRRNNMIFLLLTILRNIYKRARTIDMRIRQNSFKKRLTFGLAKDIYSIYRLPPLLLSEEGVLPLPSRNILQGGEEELKGTEDGVYDAELGRCEGTGRRMISRTHEATSQSSCSTPASQGWDISVARSGLSAGFFLRQMSTKSLI